MVTVTDSLLIAEVLLPVPLSKTFDYRLDIDNTDKVRVGQRVLVEFGNGKSQVGLIMALRTDSQNTDSCTDKDNTSTDNPSHQLKTISSVLDDFPVVDKSWCELIAFASRYYAEPLGKAYKNAFPKRLRMPEPIALPRIESYHLTDSGHTAVTDNLLPKTATKQRKLLSVLSELSTLSGQTDTDMPTLRQHKFTVSDIKKAEEKGLIACTKKSPYHDDSPIVHADYELNQEQQQVLQAITKSKLSVFENHLLYGVTGSGKTEVYIHLIEKVLSAGKQVLLLVPEIALTPQMLSRFTQRFGRRVAAYHSGMTDNARRDVFLSAQAGELPVLIGTRSAIFVPQANLGLILVDEEHDLSYKQHEGFLYNARDLAIYRAKKLGISVVLGSATPSLETVYNVQQGKTQLHTLTQRATNSVLPKIQMVDRRGQSRENVLSDYVIQQMRKTLQRSKQVLVFLNRRGFAPVMKCNDCEWSSRCPSCSVFQTAHTTTRQLCCHHCGHLEPLPIRCPDCGSADVYFAGAGTQKLEAQITQQFPHHRVLRLDRDKQTTAKQLDTALEQIQNNEVDIILGTQLVVKGHHFPNVELVCVADADSALFSSDFRAEERLYQQLIQVSGRAGRESNAGQVFIQSTVPNHDVFHALMQHNYWVYAEKMLTEREQYQLPPKTATVLVKASALDKALVLDYLRNVKQALDEHSDNLETLGPIPLAIEKIKNRYQAELWLSADNKIAMQKQLSLLQQIIKHYDKSNRFRTIIDVDAV
ncbi:MAG: primosomal protein N' [Gammaproteobacteria bacterium]|nr:primosomal protein N' [Gammaproteobacteria bacterium]